MAPYGIYCGAYDAYLGKSKELAKELYRIMDGFNILDVGTVFLGTDQEKIKTFMNILKKLSKIKGCPGWNAGGGNSMCGIKICTKENGYLSCAECKIFPCEATDKDKEMPLMNKAGMFDLISKRYGNWNQENLKEIKEIGYKRFIEKMEEKVKEGFMTSEVITKDNVFTEAIKKMKR